MAGAQRFAAESCRLNERAEPYPARVGEHFEPVTHEDPILAGERDHVGDGREGHVVEEMERQVFREAERAHQRLGELERHAGAAQILVLGRAVGPARIEDRAGRREGITGQVVVGDDDLHPRRARSGDAVHGGNAAVAGDDDARAHPLRLRETREAKVISVPQPVRDERVHGRPRLAQYAREQSGGALSVHVVIAVHENRSVFAHRARQDLHGDTHVGPAERIGETLELGTEERFGERRRSEAALHQDRGEGLGDVQLSGQGKRRPGVGGRGEGPARGNHSLE